MQSIKLKCDMTAKLSTIAVGVWLQSKQTHSTIGLNEVRILQTKFEFGKKNELASLVLNMFLIVFALICCIIFVLLFLWGRNKCLHFRQHTRVSCDVSYAHWHDLLHIDPTLLLFLEDREIVYTVAPRQIPFFLPLTPPTNSPRRHHPRPSNPQPYRRHNQSDTIRQ